MKYLPAVSAPRFVRAVPEKFKRHIREKAIDRARTRIAIAGSDPAKLSQQDLEVLVKEEEDQIKSSMKKNGVFAALALFGINLFG
jgi:hypothetical protein